MHVIIYLFHQPSFPSIFLPSFTGQSLLLFYFESQNFVVVSREKIRNKGKREREEKRLPPGDCNGRRLTSDLTQQLNNVSSCPLLSFGLHCHGGSHGHQSVLQEMAPQGKLLLRGANELVVQKKYRQYRGYTRFHSLGVLVFGLQGSRLGGRILE